MKNKLTKIKYLPNNFEIIEPGDYVICAISNKKIPENLTYWSVDNQEAIFLQRGSIKRGKKVNYFHLLWSKSIVTDF